ncbi:hypothetical protein A6D95_09535 [Vibrio breoganii]|nr:hypothetical protein A6D95_09535 [Vibrio breoganii]
MRLSAEMSIERRIRKHQMHGLQSELPKSFQLPNELLAKKQFKIITQIRISIHNSYTNTRLLKLAQCDWWKDMFNELQDALIGGAKEDMNLDNRLLHNNT